MFLNTKIIELEKELKKRPTYRELIERELENDIRLEKENNWYNCVYCEHSVYIGDMLYGKFRAIDKDDVFKMISENKDWFNKIKDFDKKVSKYKKEIKPIYKKYFGDVR